MEILVNREPLDFRLENESSVGEVVDGLADWLSSGRFAITSLDVNATPYAIHDRSAWEDISVDEVDELRVEALPLNRVDHTTIVALDEYCSLLREALEKGAAEPLGELVAELPYVRARLVQFFPSLAGADDNPDLLDDTDLEHANLPPEPVRRQLIEEIDALRTILASREREYRDPNRELALTLGQLSASRDALVEVPVQLQTGHQQAAMQTVVTVTELLSRLMRLIPLVESAAADDSVGIDIRGVRGFAEELAPLLVELSEAFEAQDTVLIGDLLEYEVAPRFEQLESLLPAEDGS